MRAAVTGVASVFGSNTTFAIASGASSSGAGPVPDPFCLCYVNDVEVGLTSVCPHTHNPTWDSSEKITIRIPENVDQQPFQVRIEVYNMLSIKRGEFLGQVSFSFWSLFCLQNGEFTFKLMPSLSDMDQYIHASITFSLQIYQPLWDSIRTHSSPAIHRSISIVSCTGLPFVNNQLPSTKTIILVDGGVKAKSSVKSASCDPKYDLPAHTQLLLDYRQPVTILLRVLYVDVNDKREVCIGEVSLPVEFLLRPPTESFDLWLTPPSRKPPKAYEFVVDGCVTVSVTSSSGNNAILWEPWINRKKKPLEGLSYEVEEVSEVVSYALYSGKEVPLDSSECQWFGTATSFTSPSHLLTRDSWLLLPLKGMGVQVDEEIYGVHPTKQYCIAIERSVDQEETDYDDDQSNDQGSGKGSQGGQSNGNGNGKGNGKEKRKGEKRGKSDHLMLNSVWKHIEKCLLTVRRRDLYQHIRQRSLEKIRSFFESMIRKGVFQLGPTFRRMAKTVATCFPGATFFICLVSKDQKSLLYTIFESSTGGSTSFSGATSSGSGGGTSEVEPLFFTLWSGQGLDWECIGRHAGCRHTINADSVISASASLSSPSLSSSASASVSVSPSDSKNIPISFCRFHQFRAPRLSCPLTCGDVSIGAIGLENLDVYKAGLAEKLYDLPSIESWLSSVAELCGEALYSGKERKVLNFLQSYLLYSSSSRKGLVRIILEHGLSVLQGCRLMEIWSLSGEGFGTGQNSGQSPQLKSLATSWPESKRPPSRWVSLENITLHFIAPPEGKKKALTAAQNVTTAVMEGMSELFFGKKTNKNQLSQPSSLPSAAAPNGEGNAQAARVATTAGAGAGTGTGTEDEDDPSPAAAASSSSSSSCPYGVVFGVYYGGFEQYQFVRYFATKAETIDKLSLKLKSVKLFLANDRNINLSLYLVDANLSIIDHFSGSFQLVTFKERNISCGLTKGHKHTAMATSTGAAGGGSFQFTSNFGWPSASSRAETRAIAMKALQTIAHFQITIHRASGLSNTGIVGSSDPFCEIYWKGALIGKTSVMKDTLEPNWEESFALSVAGVEESDREGQQAMAAPDPNAEYTCRVEVWDMDFIGKGAFFGEFELQLDQLLLPPTSEIAVALLPKESHPKAKNKDVGGTLVLTHSLVKRDEGLGSDDEEKLLLSGERDDSDEESDDGGGAAGGGLYPLTRLEIKTIQRLLDHEDPVLKLTVERAEGLGRADLLGLSDPYVKVFKMDGKTRERSTDPVAMTRVIEKTLNPVWNEDLIVALNINTAALTQLASTSSSSSSSQPKRAVTATAAGNHPGKGQGLGNGKGKGKGKGKDKGGPGLLDDWPVFLLEVWDKDAVGVGSFLGEITLSPPRYTLSRSLERVALSASQQRDAKGNKLVQGTLTLKFRIQENRNVSGIQKFIFSPMRTLHRRVQCVVNIISAKAVGKAPKGFNAKPLNPYAVLKWNDEKIGETATKWNSIDPEWANERFTFDITKAVMLVRWEPLLIEIWNRPGTAAGGAAGTGAGEDQKLFLGVVTIPMIELLHPDQGAVLRRKIYLPSASATATAAAAGGTGGGGGKETGGVLTLRLSRVYQPQLVSVKYKELRQLPMNLYGDNETDADDGGEAEGQGPGGKGEGNQKPKDPIELMYGQEKTRVITTEPVPLEMILDLEEEKKRQRIDRLTLPGILSKVEHLNQRYSSNPFDQLGLISELHYGQTVSAFKFNKPTVLHIGREADAHVMPAVAPPIDLSTQLSSYESEFMNQYAITETSTSAAAAGGATGSEGEEEDEDDEDEGEDGEEGSHEKAKAKAGTEKKKEELLQVEKEGELCLVCRYPSKKIPQRDVAYLSALRDTMVKSLTLFQHREKRKRERELVLQKFSSMHSNINRYTPEDVILTALRDLDLLYQCHVSIYLLQPIGQEQGQGQQQQEQQQQQQNSRRPHGNGRHGQEQRHGHGRHGHVHHIALMPCSSLTGAIDDSLGHRGVGAFVNMASRLARHGLLLQFYRGASLVAGYDWKPGFSQASLVTLESLSSDLSVIEGRGICREVSQRAIEDAPMGSCVFPLMVGSEVTLGVVVISGTDKLPHSIYCTEKKVGEVPTSAAASPTTSAARGAGGGARGDGGGVRYQRDIREMFEEGTTEGMRDIGRQLGKTLFAASMVSAIKDVKTFPVREDTEAEDVMRYAFRRLLEAIPMLSEISVWKVYVPSGEEEMSSSALLFSESKAAGTGTRTGTGEEEEEEDSIPGGMSGFAARFFGTQRQKKNKRAAAAGGVIEKKSSSLMLLRKSSSIDTFAGKDGEGVAASGAGAGAVARIEAGFFKSESGLEILSTGNEKTLYQQLYDINTSSSDSAAGAGVSGRGQVVARRSKAQQLKLKEEQQRRRGGSGTAAAGGTGAGGGIISTGAAIAFAISRTEYARVVPWVVSTPGSLRREAFTAMTSLPAEDDGVGMDSSISSSSSSSSSSMSSPRVEQQQSEGEGEGEGEGEEEGKGDKAEARAGGMAGGDSGSEEDDDVFVTDGHPQPQRQRQGQAHVLPPLVNKESLGQSMKRMLSGTGSSLGSGPSPQLKSQSSVLSRMASALLSSGTGGGAGGELDSSRRPLVDVDPVEFAHREILRSLSLSGVTRSLSQSQVPSSLHLGSGIGIYLCRFARGPDGVVDGIIGKAFGIEPPPPVPVPVSAAASLPSKLSSSATLPPLVAESKGGATGTAKGNKKAVKKRRKKTSAGASSGEESEEEKTKTKTTAGGPPKLSSPPPPPKGPKPDPKDKDKAKGKGSGAKKTKPSANKKAAPAAPLSPSPAAAPQPSGPHYEFFLAVKTNGIGGEQGYGVIGEEVSGQVEHMVRTLEAVLAKLFALKTKAKEMAIAEGQRGSLTTAAVSKKPSAANFATRGAPTAASKEK